MIFRFTFSQQQRSSDEPEPNETNCLAGPITLLLMPRCISQWDFIVLGELNMSGNGATSVIHSTTEKKVC